jgi:hypothetical protein
MHIKTRKMQAKDADLFESTGVNGNLREGTTAVRAARRKKPEPGSAQRGTMWN